MTRRWSSIFDVHSKSSTERIQELGLTEDTSSKSVKPLSLKSTKVLSLSWPWAVISTSCIWTKCSFLSSLHKPLRAGSSACLKGGSKRNISLKKHYFLPKMEIQRDCAKTETERQAHKRQRRSTKNEQARLQLGYFFSSQGAIFKTLSVFGRAR
jgi:hypothetical protein